MDHPILYVRWIDSANVDADVAMDNLDTEPVTVESVGFLVAETETAVVLARCRYEDHAAGKARRPCIIPKGVILERQTLEFPN